MNQLVYLGLGANTGDRESNLFTGKSLFGVIKIPILRIDMEIIVAKTANITFMFFLIYNLYKTMCSFLNLI